MWEAGAQYQSSLKKWSFPPGVMDVQEKYNQIAGKLGLSTPKKKAKKRKAEQVQVQLPLPLQEEGGGTRARTAAASMVADSGAAAVAAGGKAATTTQSASAAVDGEKTDAPRTDNTKRQRRSGRSKR